MAGRAPAPKAPARPPAAGKPATRSSASAPAKGRPSAPAPSEGPEPGADEPRPSLLDEARGRANRTSDRAGQWWRSNPSKRSGKQQIAHDTGGLLFGLIVYSLVINGIRYGMPGVKGWLSAKFVNRPVQGLAAGGAGGGSGQGGGGKPDESLVSGQSGGSGTGVSV